MRRKSFTLIELLIVVAIIAILAAIAVPNFLEAQVRAKIARAKSDMRSVRTGLEAYAVDNNQYPDPWQDLAPGATPPDYRYHTTLLDAPMMTTPAAYLTSALTDPFPLKEPNKYYPNPAYLDRGKYYRYYNPQRYEGMYDQLSKAGLKWFLMSNGPDLENSVGVLPNDVATLVVDETIMNDVLDDMTGQGTGRAYMYYGYDATNGTISWGDIIVNNVKGAQ